MNKLTKVLTLALILIVCSVGVAAQETPTTDPLLTPDPAMTVDPAATTDMPDTTGSMNMMDGPDVTGGELQVGIQSVVDAPGDYVGQVVTLEGIVSELVNVRAFILREDAVIAADGVLVINNSGRAFDLNVTRDRRFLITGTVHAPIDEVYGEDNTGYDPEYYRDYFDNYQVEDENLSLYESVFNDYRGWTVIEITNAGNIVPAVTLQELAAGAGPYDDGRVYAVEGYVNDIINDNLFILGEGAAIANARVLVFAPGTTDADPAMGVTEFGLDYETAYDQDFRVRVYGTLTNVGDADFNDEFTTWNDRYSFGLDLNTVYDDEALAGYEIDAWEAIYADLIVPLPGE